MHDERIFEDMNQNVAQDSEVVEIDGIDECGKRRVGEEPYGNTLIFSLSFRVQVQVRAFRALSRSQALGREGPTSWKIIRSLNQTGCVLKRKVGAI